LNATVCPECTHQDLTGRHQMTNREDRTAKPYKLLTRNAAYADRPTLKIRRPPRKSLTANQIEFTNLVIDHLDAARAPRPRKLVSVLNEI
jgi:hypothetical protein